MDWYTVIPTKDRPTELDGLLHSLRANGVGDPRKILVINNGMADSVSDWARGSATVILDTQREPHIYSMWNVGLAWAERHASEYPTSSRTKPHAVAILNDDVELPPDFAARMIQCLRDTDCTIAFPDQGPGVVNQVPGNVCCRGCSSDCAVPNGCKTPRKRITGYAFVVNGQHGIRCDEDFKWWFGDDDLDWQARRDYSGTWEVPGVTVKHKYPSQSTNESPALTEQAGRDRETFVKKWGKAPW